MAIHGGTVVRRGKFVEHPAAGHSQKSHGRRGSAKLDLSDAGIKEHLGKTHPNLRSVDLQQMDPTLRGQVVERLAILGQTYPQGAKGLTALEATAIDDFEGTVAAVNPYTGAMVFDTAEWGSVPAMNQLNSRSGSKMTFGPDGSDLPLYPVTRPDAKYYVTHEYGHIVHRQANGGGPDGPWTDTVSRAYALQAATNAQPLSSYALNSPIEWWGEVFGAANRPDRVRPLNEVEQATFDLYSTRYDMIESVYRGQRDDPAPTRLYELQAPRPYFDRGLSEGTVVRRVSKRHPRRDRQGAGRAPRTTGRREDRARSAPDHVRAGEGQATGLRQGRLVEHLPGKHDQRAHGRRSGLHAAFPNLKTVALDGMDPGIRAEVESTLIDLAGKYPVMAGGLTGVSMSDPWAGGKSYGGLDPGEQPPSWIAVTNVKSGEMFLKPDRWTPASMQEQANRHPGGGEPDFFFGKPPFAATPTPTYLVAHEFGHLAIRNDADHRRLINELGGGANPFGDMVPSGYAASDAGEWIGEVFAGNYVGASSVSPEAAEVMEVFAEAVLAEHPGHGSQKVHGRRGIKGLPNAKVNLDKMAPDARAAITSTLSGLAEKYPGAAATIPLVTTDDNFELPLGSAMGRRRSDGAIIIDGSEMRHNGDMARIDTERLNRNTEKGGRTLVDPTVPGMVTHEFGHTVAAHSGVNPGIYSSLGGGISDGFPVSRYASGVMHEFGVNSNEAFAEAFVAFTKGESMHPDLQRDVEEIIAKSTSKPLAEAVLVEHGTHNQKTHGRRGGRTPALEASLAEAEDGIRRVQGGEVMVVLDPTTGAILHRRQAMGDPDGPGPMQAGMALTKQEAVLWRGKVVTHNHPATALLGGGDVPLGTNDVNAMLATGAIEMRAVSPSGSVSSLRAPKGGWGGTTAPIGAVRANEDFVQTVDRVSKGWSERYAKGDLSIGDANSGLFDEALREWAPRHGATYEVYPP